MRLEGRDRQRLGEDVCRLLERADPLRSDDARLDLLTQEVVAHVDVLAARRVGLR